MDKGVKYRKATYDQLCRKWLIYIVRVSLENLNYEHFLFY